MSAGDKFGAGWDIRNTGTATWEPGSFQFTYLGGYRLSHDPVKRGGGNAHQPLLVHAQRSRQDLRAALAGLRGDEEHGHVIQKMQLRAQFLGVAL